ncbi:hypothetical protein OJ967_25455 [Peribacillus frigoritolerans]|uniref:hypothetical protein n=1 Tax=Peribacillus frigoritolerans TaxID=450367 RepID=UPI002227D7A8|nr:hypothetical protein [Peribacillus frigoritolerans]UYY98659.1 hypothetical protein OJ967_25455 [Peribacillus frigoritolerans]
MTSIIAIREAYKHLGGEERYPTERALYSLHSRIRNLIQHGVVQGDIDDKAVDIESLKKYLELESNIAENYMILSEFRELLGVSREISGGKIKGIFKVWEAEFSFDYVETEFPIYNRTFFISKSSVERFFRDYISMDEVKSVVSKSHSGWQKTFKRLEITPLKIGLKRFIKKSEFEKNLDDAAIGNDKFEIPMREAYKHLGGKEKYPTGSAINSLNSRIRRLIQSGIVRGNEDDKVVDIESLKKYVEFESNILENFMGIAEFHELLGTNRDTTAVEFKEILKGLEAAFSFDYVETEYSIYHRTFFISKSSVERFLRNYVSMDEVESVVSKSHSGWSKALKRFKITPLKIGQKRFIKKCEFEMILDDAAIGIDKSDYYTLAEFKQILSVTYTRDALVIEKDYDLKPKKLYGRWKFYKKDLIDSLKLRQTELKEKYISFPEAKELAAAEGFLFDTDYIEGEPINSLLRPFFKHKTNMYSKETFNNWLEERKKRTNFFSVSMESNFDTFKYRSNIKGIDINELGPFTSETWLEFISSRLRSSTANPQTMDSYISRYVYQTEQLINLVSSTKKREIYSVTSNDINILFNEIPKKDSVVIYKYLKAVYNQLIAKKIEAFNFNRVNDPDKFEENHHDKSIYEYEVYKKVYNYTKDLSLHKERAIKDTLKEITTKGEKRKVRVKYYATSWLYVLLHLNNAWRHSDVITFSQVNLSGTQITDLNWILENELSDEDADYIIKQVYRAEFIISKTRVKNYFFCSEELKKPFATAIAICQLRVNALSPLRESIIDFGNKKQDFSDTRRRNFFKLYDDKEFHFSSRKMNRSLMSYIYILLSKMQKGTAGLKTIQKMRGHTEQETTNIYVDIPEEELNFLTRQLFVRGSFGFIYDTFLDVLQGDEIDREKRTTEIQLLEKHFGSIQKIEEISGFLNIIQSERKAILDRILTMGLDEALEFVNKIETNQLPSKQDNVQCMLAESGCVKKGQGVSCFDCAYSIPNYYALSALGASLQDRLNSYLDSQKTDSEMPYYEQRKRARLFYIQLDMFAQAIQKFGFDVYEFIKDSREEFIAKQDGIGSLIVRYQLT